jgi:catechol 2,3-dioxygenase-like lactoylglutathione lyase family enzyme
MTILVSHTFITVHDQEVALAFYRDVLGLEVRADVPLEGFRWLTVGAPGQEGAEIVLEVPEMGRGEAAPAIRTMLAKGNLAGAMFAVDDLDAAFERVRASGAEIMQEPTDMFYGVRDCAFRDPSGNHLRVSQKPA